MKRILEQLGWDGLKHFYVSGSIPQKTKNILYPSLPFEFFYKYQLDVVSHIQHTNIFISAPTGSGKTLAFALAYAKIRESIPTATMLLLYPLKALARDQINSLYNIFQSIPHMKKVKIMPYDGDVSSSAKREALLGADIVVSNFYGMHLYLASHGSWARFLSNLSLVVVDEAHVYTGVFGTHVSYVIRRLRRLAQLYGSSPKFIMSSATVSSAEDSAFSLVGEPFKVIEVDGLSMHSKDLYFAPVSSSQGRKQLKSLLKLLIDYGFKGMVFFKSREELERVYHDMAKGEYKDEILPYRSGYDIDTRRYIEGLMRSGDISFLLTTSAMELGIDIGEIDVVIMYGFPENGFSSFWQRAGRAGRKGHGYVISLLKENNALDMYIYDHPDIVLTNRGNSLYIDARNPNISLKQLSCAAWEYPIDENRDSSFFNIEVIDIFVKRYGEKLLPSSKGLVLLDEKPHGKISLNEGDSNSFRIINIDNGQMIEKVEMWRVFKKHYPGSVYFYMGVPYVVKFVDLEKHVVGVKETKDVRETIPIGWEDIDVISVTDKQVVGKAKVYLGTLNIKSYTLGFSYNKGVYLFNGVMYRSFITKGIWFNVYKEDLKLANDMFRVHIPILGVDSLTDSDIFAGSLHALEHVLINVLPLIAISTSDVGGYSIPSVYKHVVKDIKYASVVYVDSDRKQFPSVALDIKDNARIYIYDGHPGGVGIADKIFRRWRDIVKYAGSRLDECKCEKGCPACVMSHSCGNGNRPLNKLGSRSLLRNIFLV